MLLNLYVCGICLKYLVVGYSWHKFIVYNMYYFGYIYFSKSPTVKNRVFFIPLIILKNLILDLKTSNFKVKK